MKAFKFLLGLVILAAICILGGRPAPAAEPPKKDAPAANELTIAQGLTILEGLLGLDGHFVVVKNAAGNDVMSQTPIPWVFENSTLRLLIASDENILNAMKKTVEDTRNAMIKEALIGKPPGTELKAPMPEFDAFLKQWTELLAKPLPGAKDLGHIKGADLKLDKNEIPPSTLAAIMPILDK